MTHLSFLLTAALMAVGAASAAAQRQFEELGKRGLPAAEDQTTSTALGDVDRDGDVDLVVGNFGQSRLYLNNGTGTFTDATASRMPAGNYDTTSLALGDVDRDGDLDLVVGNHGQSRLYVNNGTGTFMDVTALPVGSYDTNALALDDMDGDGDLDLVLGNGSSSGQQSRLYLNNGTGTFTDATAFRMPVGFYNTTSLALGDVDGDGDLDLVLGNAGQQGRLYLNSGTGTFTDATASRMPVGIYDTWSLAFGDVDGDGDLDLVVGNNGQNRLYLNNGTGAFMDATAARMPVAIDFTRWLALLDVDQDGDLDLLVGNRGRQSRFYLNNGTGTFTDAAASRLPFGSYNTTSLALGDIDQDGDLDLVVGNWAQQNRRYLNNGTGTFTDATTSLVGSYNTTALALGDVDRDRDLDLIVGNSGQQNRLYVNTGTDATASRMPIAIERTTSLALGDVDRDGDLDLVVGNIDQSRLYLNLLRQLDAPYVLHVGRNYQLDVYSRYGPTTLLEVASPFLSTGSASIPFPPLGTIGIDPTRMIALPPFVVPQPAGIGSLTIPIPNVRALAGITFYTQVLLDQQPVQVRLTNVVDDVTLR